MRGRHHIYELVEDTNTSKHNNIEVVLKSFVEGVGGKGDVISLKSNFAYNKLLLPGLAVYKTEENVAKYAKKENDKIDLEHSSPFAQRVSSNDLFKVIKSKLNIILFTFLRPLTC